MKNKKDYGYLLPLSLVLVTIALPLFGIYQYYYWKEFIGDENGYNSVNTVIALCGGFLNIITIAFLYINYYQQKKDGENNNRDTEFNRALDMIYRQLEQSQRRLEKNPRISHFVSVTIVSTMAGSKHLYGNYESHKETLYFINEEIHLFKIILFNGSLSKDDINKLFTVVHTNFGITFSKIYYYLDSALKMDNNDLRKELMKESNLSVTTADEFITKIQPLKPLYEDYKLFQKLNKTHEDIEEYKIKMILPS